MLLLTELLWLEPLFAVGCFEIGVGASVDFGVAIELGDEIGGAAGLVV